MPELQFPLWVPVNIRHDLQAIYDGIPPGPGQDLVARLATDSRMHTFWKHLSSERAEAYGGVFGVALLYSTNEFRNALVGPKDIRTFEDTEYAIRKTPLLTSLSVAATAARLLYERTRAMAEVVAAGWCPHWRGVSEITPDKLLAILGATADFYERYYALFESLTQGVPQITWRGDERADQRAFAAVMSQAMQVHCRQPYDEAVAVLVDVVFNLPEDQETDPEAVRSLRRSRRKATAG